MLPKLTVWYNTRCPVCDAGISRQRRRLVEALRSGAIEFHDINTEPDALAKFGASLEDVRRRLHAVEADRLHVGTDAFVQIWLRTPGEAFLARLFRLPLIRPLARACYDRFADLLYAWNRWRGHW